MKTTTAPDYPIVVGDVLTAGTKAYKIVAAGSGDPTICEVDELGGFVGNFYTLPEELVRTIGTVDPQTGTPRV